MGVQGLWSLVGPAARPVQLESLRNRKMAVDASIWIHQFMRTMRDKEGNALRNGHLLGFFRRLCKLLFYNIKPVFVFDGGAPALKRLTIRERRRRREGIAMNMRRTAEKILSAQVKTRVLLEEEKRRKRQENTDEEYEDKKEENYVYMEELSKSAALEELKQKRKRDQYELPPMPNEEPTNKIDARLATQEELIDFINQYRPGKEEIDSEAFMALPPEMQYEIIQDLKLKSRQTSWARLEEMVRQSRTALDFSKQQIKQLMHRNEMTQRMLQMNDVANRSTGSPIAVPTRIAGERSREYILVKNENLEEGLGWRLPGLSPSPAKKKEEEEEKSRPEPPKEVLSEMREEPRQSSGDKVRDAVAANPKLAALLSAFESDEENESENEEMVQVDLNGQEHEEKDEDEEPLFLNRNTQAALKESSFIPNSDEEEELLFLDQQHRREQQETKPDTSSLGYGNQLFSDSQDTSDEALHQIIQKIYDQDELEAAAAQESPKKDEVDETALDAQDFYDLWLSRVPDAFLYRHSLNDEYKHILRDAIFSQNIDQIQTSLRRVQKSIGKSNGRDTLAIESMTFHEKFLENALKWKEKNGQASLQQQTPEHEDALSKQDREESNDVKLEEQQQQQQKEFNSFIASNVSEEEKNESNAANAVTQPGLMRISLSPDSTDYVLEKADNKTISADDDQMRSKETTVPVEKKAIDADQRMEDTISKELPKDINDPQRAGLTNDLLSTKVATKAEDSSSPEQFQMVMQQDITEAIKEQESLPVNPDVVPDNQGYNSDEELLGDVEEEESEYARFVSDIADKDLESVREELYRDLKDLNKQQRKEMGNTDDVTNQMVQDIQEMLRLFGIPYIVSPMEAEAQCAELVRLSLVEGIVTDDSDVFLFGATRVYKNMFNQQKYVECYLAQDVEREMRLDRKKLIQLAYLLGSDYTDGIPGVGPVAAMEILAEFCKPDDKDILTPLRRFRTWYESGRDDTEFQKKFRKMHKQLEFPDEFPNPLVVEAYYHPMVDSSQQEFEWGTPQLDSLRLFLMESFTWSEKKTDEVLIPVIREMNKRKTIGKQSNIATFFDSSGGASANFAPHKRKPHSSRRVQKIVNQWRRQDEGSPEQEDQPSTDKERKTKRVRRN